MKKKQLLVLATSLLLAGTLATGCSPSKKAITEDLFTAPTGINETYNMINQDLAVGGRCEVGTFYYSLDKESWSEEIPYATDAGNYSVYWYIKGNEGYKDYSKNEPKVVESVIGKMTLDETKYITPKAYSVVGIKDGGIALTHDGDCPIADIKYSLDKTNWSTEAPKATTAGEYTVYWYIEGNNNVNPVGSQTECFSLETEAVEKQALVPGLNILPPSISDWEYDGEEHELLAPPLFFESEGINDATFYYSLDKENWSKDIPTAVGKADEDTMYTTYWYLDSGSSIYQDVGSKESPIENDVFVWKKSA